MSWWGDKSANSQQILEPELPPVETAQARVREVKCELDALDAEMRVFKTTHHVQTDRFGRLLGVQCAEITGKAAVEREWRALLKRRDSLVSAWHKALFEWSELKGAAK